MADSNDILTMLRDSAMGYLSDNASAPAGGIAIDAPQAVDRDRWREIAELGWLGLGIPESQGGSGLNVMAACVLAEQFGVYASRLPYVACAVMPAKILEHCADHAETAALIERLICGDGLITLAWQEAVNTLDTQPVQTRLENNVITGRKLFVPAAADDSLLLVSVSTSDGPAIAAVEASAPGVHREIFASSGAALAHIRFDQTPLYRGALLRVGEPATQALQQAVDAGRIAISAQLAGTASGCLEKTLQYLRDREQFGKPLANFQALRHRAVDMSMAARLAGASWRNGAKTFDESSDSQAADAAISAAKARCGDTALQVAKESVQMHGAMGFTEDTGVGAYYRAALFANGWLGNASLLRRDFLQTYQSLKAREGLAHG